MIDIDNTMTRDEAAKPSRRHRPRGGRKNRKGSRDDAEPSKKLFDPDSGELFDPEEEARKAEAEKQRQREERERQAQIEKEALTGHIHMYRRLRFDCHCYKLMLLKKILYYF